jgi:exopolysaccharide production protein ExoQ
MNSNVALILCVIFVIGLLKIDRKRTFDVSLAIWIPLIWFLILASRPVAGWFYGYGGFYSSEEDYMIGSTIDRNVLITLIAAGLMVLGSRKQSWRTVTYANLYVGLFIVYCGIAILWSDYPGIAIKRYFRGLGTFIMFFVVLTEKSPLDATKLIIRRLGYILIPFSILLIKYFRDVGIVYGQWLGEEMIIGVCTHKNQLGQLSAVCGLYFFWQLAESWRNKRILMDKIQMLINGLLLLMVLWLLTKAGSATSNVSLIAAVCIYLGLGLSFVKRNIDNIGLIMSLLVGIAFVILFPFNLIEPLVDILGRDMTLTDRVSLWKDLIELAGSPVIGTGFDSFWLGDRLNAIWEKWAWRPNQTHNGYIDVYLDLGFIGLLLMAGVLLNIYRNMRKTLQNEFEFGRFQMAYFGAFLLLNITEASMKFRSFSFAIVLLLALYRTRALDRETV